MKNRYIYTIKLLGQNIFRIDFFLNERLSSDNDSNDLNNYLGILIFIYTILP